MKLSPTLSWCQFQQTVDQQGLGLLQVRLNKDCCMKVVIDYKAMSIDEKGVKEVVRSFKKKGSEIVAIDVPGIVKKSSGVAYKEVSLSFADSQIVTLRVSEKNAVFQAVLNGRVVPIKNQDNLEKAVIELIDMMDAGRKAFVKKLEARKMEVPQKATTSTSALRAELQAKRDGLKDSVESLERELSELRQVEETVPAEPESASNQADGEKIAPDTAASQDDNRFADTGYIAGSRKEMAASFIRDAGKNKRQLGVTDIDWLAIEENPREAGAVIVKANVIGETDYEALVDGGMKPATAFLISKVYASIAPKPVTDSPKARKAYVRGIETLRKNLEAMKEPEEVSNYLRNTVYEEMTEPQYTAEEIELREQLLRDYKNGKPDAKLKWLEIRKAALERTKQEGDLYAAWNSLGERFVGVVKHRFNTGSKAFNDAVKEAKYRGKPDSLDWAQKKQTKKAESDSESSETKKPRFELFVSDSYERIGGRTVSVDSTKALKDQFGLRDIQSGNWVLKDKASAEFHVTRSAEAFADMADILGIEDSKISIGGRLAMAFGARGKAGARAHYESVHRVINLTKMNGGGSLGHEWFHAFDNLLVEKMGLGVSGAGDFLTEAPELAGETPVAKAFSALVSAMKVGSIVVDRVVKYDMRDIEVLKYNLKVRNSFLVKLTSAKDFQEAFEMINDPSKAYKKGAKEQFERLAAAHFGGDYASSMTAKEKLNETEFYRNALMLDGDKKKKYWSTNLEMAARAFSSYLEDKLEQQGRKNDYLSNHANNDVNAYGFINAKPFPEGEERERINAAFDALFAVVKQENVMDSIIEMLDNDETCDREKEVLGTDFDFDLLNASDIELADEDFEV